MVVEEEEKDEKLSTMVENEREMRITNDLKINKKFVAMKEVMGR